MSATSVENGKESMASRKQAAAEQRKARKAARDPRNRLLSDSSDERMPKGILKNSRIPTKRSVSECVDDLSQIMADLDLNIHDLPKANRKFCSNHQYFEEEDEDDVEGEERDCEDEGGDNRNYDNTCDEKQNNDIKLKKCDCDLRYSDSSDNGNENEPKKSVRFDERVYETFFFASRLYDRRYFAKYHFSSRHHPPINQQNKKKKRSKSESSKDEFNGSAPLKSENSCCKQSKSQRAKQSKKDKKRRLNKKDDATETSSEDQGYCSSLHSFSE